MTVERRLHGGEDGALTAPGGEVTHDPTFTPRTFAEAAAVDAPDVVRSDPKYRWGWYDGALQTLAVIGIDTDPVIAASAGEVQPYDELLADVTSRNRAELARARKYTTPPRTVEQIAAETAWSWRCAEREIAEREIAERLRVVA